MSFDAGNWGRVGRTVFGTPLYWSMAVAICLSTETGASMKGLAAMKYLLGTWLAWTRTLVVWPGAISMAFVVNGFV